MLRPNHLKARLQNHQASTGAWLFMGSASAAEVMSHMAFDALILDLEHTAIGLGELVAQMRAATRASGPSLMVRVPDASATVIKPVLDAGAEGLFLPVAETADEIAALLDASRYPPHGKRGLHYTVSRAANWGEDSEAYAAAHETETLIVAMIESAKGVAHIPEMAAVGGVDMFFVGPLDLSASVGVPGQYDHPAFMEIWTEAERRILESGAKLGGTILPGHSAPTLFERGYSFVTVGADVAFLRAAASGALKDVKASHNV